MPKVLIGEIRWSPLKKSRPNYRHPSYSVKLKVEHVRLGEMVWPEDRADERRLVKQTHRQGGVRACAVTGCGHKVAAHEPDGDRECTMPGCPCRKMKAGRR